MSNITQNLKQRFNKDNKGQARKQKKNDKRSLENGLKSIFNMANAGEIAQLNHNGQTFLMVKVKPPLQQIAHNGAPHILIPAVSSPEIEEYQTAYQKLLQTMGKLNYEQKGRDEFVSDEQFDKHVEIMNRNEDLFAILDEMTFEFSEGFGKTPQQRKTIISKFNKIFEDNPVLDVIASGKVQK